MSWRGTKDREVWDTVIADSVEKLQAVRDIDALLVMDAEDEKFKSAAEEYVYRGKFMR